MNFTDRCLARLPESAQLRFPVSLSQCQRFLLAAVAALLIAAPAAFADTAEELLAGARADVSNLDTTALQNLLAEKDNVVMIDVRMPDEIARRGGGIDAGSRQLVVNRGWLEFRIDDYLLDKDTPIVVYCGINERSPLAAQTLGRLGYSEVYNYSDGAFAWRDAGLPMLVDDGAPGNQLYRLPQQVIPGVYSAIGATAPPTFENSGHNNNLSFILTDDGVVVVNAGDNYLLAQALHAEIHKLTSAPVRYVVLENGQGHAMLGMNYWQDQGAEVIAHVDTAAEIEAHGQQILDRMLTRNRDKGMGTRLSTPDITFEDNYDIRLGGKLIEVKNLGPAHSPGDIVVWLAEHKLVISGDMAFHQRLLPVFEETDTAAWLESWENFEALEAEIVIPGHGDPTDMATVRRYTKDYLSYIRAEIAKILDAGGSLIDAYKIDQSDYAHLDTFYELAGLNVDTIFKAMEFE